MQTLVTYHAQPGSESEDRLRLLARQRTGSCPGSPAPTRAGWNEPGETSRDASCAGQRSGSVSCPVWIRAGTLRQLTGIGEVTAQVVARAAAGQEPEYLTRLLGGGPPALPVPLRAAMRGDGHVHSDWSDGGTRHWRWRWPREASGTSGWRS